MSRPEGGDAIGAAAVAGCAAGDAEALEMLYIQHAPSCLALARSILLDVHHAEDAVQEAYLDLWRHASRFDCHRSSVRAWLLLLTHHKAVDRIRNEQARKTVELVPEHDRADQRPGPEAQAMAELSGRQVRQALVELPLTKLESVVLAYWGGYTQKEIAGLTNVPVGTVKSRMHWALKNLGATLGVHTKESEPALSDVSDEAGGHWSAHSDSP